MAVWRVQTAGGERVARGPVEGGPVELLEGTLDSLLASGSLDAPADGPVPAGSVVLATAAGQEPVQRAREQLDRPSLHRAAGDALAVRGLHTPDGHQGPIVIVCVDV